MSARGTIADLDDRPESLLIAGAWRRASDGRTSEVVSPVDGVRTAQVAVAGPEDLREAVASARRAFDEGPWPRMPGRERAQILYDAADLVEEETGRLAWCQAVEMGKPVHFGERDDVPFAAMALRFFAALASQGPGFGRRANPSVAKTASREPLGVVAALTEFHHPLAMAAAIVCPALAMGDSVVLRPPASAPVSVLEFVDLCARAGLPPGVLNVVTGGREVAEGLAAHPGVDLAAYVGGPDLGRAVAMAGARAGVPVELDIGRPTVHMVFEDACLEHSVRHVARALLPGRAEFRAAGIRILIHEAMYRRFADRLAALAHELSPADPRDPATRLGPLVGREERDRLESYLGWSGQHGARLLPGPSAADHGLYRSLQLIEDSDCAMARKLPEVLAPLAFVTPFRTQEQAVGFANTVLGMQSCTVYTADMARAHLVADAIRSEVCRISTCSDAPGQSSSWFEDEDADESGPLREFDIETAYPFTRPKSVWVDVPL